MASNKLILRNTASPYAFPYPDIVKGSVLSWADGDNNFIFLKGLAIQNGSYDSGDSTITLNRIDGSTIEISGITGGGGGSGATMFVSTDNYTSGVTRTITHNLGTENVMVQLNYDDELVFGEVSNYQTNSVDVTLNQTINNVKTLVLGGPITSGGTGGGTDVFVTGGTYTGSTIIFTNTTGGTFSVTGITGGGGGGIDVFVTGGTYSAGTMEFTNNTGGTFNVSGFSANTIFSSTDNYVSGVTQTINHNLNTKDIVAQLIDTSNNELIEGYISNYQNNSVDVQLTDTLNDIKIVIVGSGAGSGGSGVDVFVSGGTYSASTLEFTNTTGGTFSITGITGGSGSTSPGGSNTSVQYNDGGSFGGNSSLTYDSATTTFKAVSSPVSGRTTSLGTGQLVPLLGGNYFGFGTSYCNSATSGVTVIGSGDLRSVGGGDDSTVIGYIHTGGTEQHLFNGSKGVVSLISRDANDEYSSIAFTPSGVTLQLNTTGTTNFQVTDSAGDPKFEVDSDGNVGVNGVFQFPTGDGTSGQVMCTNGGGVLSWTSVSGGGGSSIIISGSGNDSTVRCNVSNSASGNYSAALAGCSNSATTTYATIVGGCGNTATGDTSFIGGGRENTTLGTHSTIAGGCGNSTFSSYGTVGGGRGNCVTAKISTIGGGAENEVVGTGSTVAGGFKNCAGWHYDVVGGGRNNTASGYQSFVGGGCGNIASGFTSTVSGGYNNIASGSFDIIGGGSNNSATGGFSFIGAGSSNCVSNTYSAVLGGSGNTASGVYSAVLGGQGLTAGTNTVAAPNIDINGDITLIGSTTGGSMTNATITMPTSASTVVTVTLNGTQYGLPLFDLS